MDYLSAITVFHTVLSLLAIMAGVPAVLALFKTGAPSRMARIFIMLAVATSVTGFMFPFKGLTPAITTGLIALATLGLMGLARYRLWSIRLWRRSYAVGTVVSLYLLVFVGVVQAFLKLPVLHALAPTQSEPSFAITQIIVLLIFGAISVAAALRVQAEAVASSVLNEGIAS